jgi:TetR/AcrR family transcriptional regulator, regulator of autoinduction and epiphytic fitness
VVPTTVTREPDPRIERTRRVVLDAALALLVERGYGEVTIEAVAAESGVAKSTIYRHWPGRLELINDAFQELKPTLPAPDEGTIRERLVSYLARVAEDIDSAKWSLCLPALLNAAEHDPAARELKMQLASRGRQALVDLLADGVRSGELPDDLDTVLMAEALVGPIILRRLMSAEPLAPDQAGHLVDQVLGRWVRKPAKSKR